MAVLEKRLQLLLDAHRWALVSKEAERTHRSVASVIRESIDVYFADAAADQDRAAAAGRFLELVLDPARRAEPGEEDIGAALDEDLAGYLDEKLR
ncbi:MAG: hypothetical protein DCC50_08980 [Acidobacteria bacterium]|nr:MAG: hypothetical protein DCC50_08980 [Acidobacteriota bacterium]